MSEGTSEEDRTEEPSARRLQKAREDGEAARSNEVPAAAVMIAASFYLLLYGGSLASELRAIFTVGFVFDQGIVADASTLPTVMADELTPADIESHRRELQRAWKRLGNGWLHPGDWCAHCPAWAVCPTNSTSLTELKRAGGPLTSQRVGSIHAALGEFNRLAQV